MGHYTSGAEALALLLNLQVGRPARLDETDVEQLVVGIEAEINGILKAQGYATVPATGQADKALLGLQVRRKVAVLAYTTLYQPTGRAPDWVRMWDVDYDNFKKALQKGEQRLVDQDPTAAQAGQAVTRLFRVLPRIPED
ncbi:MAG: hypothetical protein OZ924_10685 [Burkholderiaceae bacterium]|nr:hypothetical protein [Burkholderiaceae bacterium]